MVLPVQFGYPAVDAGMVYWLLFLVWFVGLVVTALDFTGMFGFYIWLFWCVVVLFLSLGFDTGFYLFV